MPDSELRAMLFPSGRFLNGILWVMRTGAPWKDMPGRYPPYATCHRRFSKWVREGTMRKVVKALARDLHERGKLDPEEAFVDGSFAPAKKGRVRWKNQAGQGYQRGNKPRFVIGDKAYDSDALDVRLAARCLTLIVPNRQGHRRKTQDGRQLRRYKVEHFFAWLFNFRRLVVRYERRPHARILYA